MAMCADAIGVFYNNSGMLSCFDFGSGVNPDTDSDGLFWDYQYCTEQVNPEGKSGGENLLPAGQAAHCCCQLAVKFWASRTCVAGYELMSTCRAPQHRSVGTRLQIKAVSPLCLLAPSGVMPLCVQ